MDNAENTREHGRLGPAGLVHGFTWVFYGLVAPINAILLLGALLLLVDQGPVPILDWVGVNGLLYATGMLAFALGVLLEWRVAKTYLVRVFGRGIGALGALVGTISLAVAGLGYFFDINAAQALCGIGNGVECFVSRSIDVLGVVWGVAVTLCLILFVQARGAAKTVPGPKIEDRQIYPHICAAMIVFWMILTSAFWLFFRDLTTRFSTPSGGEAGHAHTPSGLLYDTFNTQMDGALGTLFVTSLGFAALIGGAAFVFIRRQRIKARLDTADDRIRRLILSPVLRAILGLSTVALAICIAAIFVHKFQNTACFTNQWLFSCDTLAEVNVVIGGVLFGLAVLIYNFADVVSGGLGVARDIVTYATMRRCGLGDDENTREANYPLRARIEARCSRVIMHVISADPAITRVTLITHSQGTVVATRVLRLYGRRILNFPGAVTLVTMGSPVTHIYRRYFPQHFPVSADLGLPGLRWINIYRKDDFVGTRIAEAPDDPVQITSEHAVTPRGHTGYFTDREVWSVLDAQKVTIF